MLRYYALNKADMSYVYMYVHMYVHMWLMHMHVCGVHVCACMCVGVLGFVSTLSFFLRKCLLLNLNYVSFQLEN